MKLFSLNVALRPLGYGQVCECEADYHLYNAHEPRMRGLIRHFLTQKQTDPLSTPDVICLQELMWFPMVEYVTGQLEQMGYWTHEIIDPRSPLNRGRMDEKLGMPIAPSGLAIFIHESSPYDIVAAGKETFSTRIALDLLCDKGFAWVMLQHKVTQQHRLVVTLHPQAYCKISSHTPACEPAMLQKLRQQITQAFPSDEAWRQAIEQVHIAQFTQIKEAIEKLEIQYKATLEQVAMLGDFNVNVYTPLPWTKEEQNRKTAETVEKGQEYVRLLKLMKFQPLRLCDGSLPFSWEGDKNSFAQGLHPQKEPPVLQRIDACWIKTLSPFYQFHALPLAILNPNYEHVERISIHPTPELAPYWGLVSCSKSNAQAQIHRQLGHKQFVRLRQQWEKTYSSLAKNLQSKSLTNKAFLLAMQKQPTWKALLLKTPWAYSSQLWKGFSTYKIYQDDWGYQQMIKNKSKWHIPLLGEPHEYRMMYDASDHHALVVILV